MIAESPVAMLVARVLMAGVFVFSAWGKFRGDERDTKAIAGLHLPRPRLWAKLVGVCEIVGAAMLTLGIAAQIAAILLGVFLLGVTLAFLQFWKIPDGDARFSAESAFFGNLGLLGGLIYVATVGAGPIAIMPGL